jgi:hypothetical protein
MTKRSSSGRWPWVGRQGAATVGPSTPGVSRTPTSTRDRHDHGDGHRLGSTGPFEIEADVPLDVGAGGGMDAMTRRRVRGNCYSAAGGLAVCATLGVRGMSGEVARLEAAGGTVYLVHGEVFRRPAGWQGHAWVEVDPPPGEAGSVARAFDRSNGVIIRQSAATYHWRLRAKNIRRYTREEFGRRILATGHWGPWDPVHTRQTSGQSRSESRRSP